MRKNWGRGRSRDWYKRQRERRLRRSKNW